MCVTECLLASDRLEFGSLTTRINVREPAGDTELAPAGLLETTRYAVLPSSIVSKTDSKRLNNSRIFNISWTHTSDRFLDRIERVKQPGRDELVHRCCTHGAFTTGMLSAENNIFYTN